VGGVVFNTLQRSVAVQVDESWMRPLPAPHLPHSAPVMPQRSSWTVTAYPELLLQSARTGDRVRTGSDNRRPRAKGHTQEVFSLTAYAVP
jgi:hypothetical protein